MPNSGINGEWFATTPEYWARVIAASGPIVGWQLWYADGSWWGSDEAPAKWYSAWERTPRYGVQVLVTHHPGGLRNLTTGRDEYTLPGERQSRRGLMIDEQQFNDVVAKAVADTWRP